MELREMRDILAAILIITIVSSFLPIIRGNWFLAIQALFFSALIVLIAVFSKKAVAYLVDSDVEHEIWKWSRYGFKPQQRLKNEVPMGLILPLLISFISLGVVRFMGVLTYEGRALKTRSAKRFGYYSFTSLTDFHNSIIGAAGIIAVLLVSFISYFLPFNLELLSAMAAFYALSNIIPISNLDGTQIFFGSKVLWSILAVITLIFTAYALAFV